MKSSMRRFAKNEAPILIILDYSGTLSLEMCLFASPRNLIKALKESTLASYGIDAPEVFWERIVNPTWLEGATTKVGYGTLIAKALGGEDDESVRQAAEDFVRRYLASSKLDERWLPLLRWLVSERRAFLLVATDHYAEATGAIIGELTRKGIPAIELLAYQEKRDKAVIVANSADLGHLKKDGEFWQKVKCILNVPFRRILLIDDFGKAENIGDAYREKSMKRREETLEAISSVFTIPVEVFDYVAEADFQEVEKWLKEKIKPAHAIV